MSSYVLDASALMALFHQEPGSDKVEQAIEDGAAISTVNLSEVASKLKMTLTLGLILRTHQRENRIRQCCQLLSMHRILLVQLH